MHAQPEHDLALEGLIHDLNNVFETIAVAADLLATDAVSRDAAAAAIHRSVERGKRLVGAIPEAGGSLEGILDNAIQFANDFLAISREGPLEFTRRISEPIRLAGSATDWERVFVNLFLNAAQATQSGGAIEITAARQPRGIEITVTDNGPGISPEILPHIFAAHFSTKGTRSGLGLHIVESIVTKNRGSVSASNRTTGTGASFSILLPAG